MGWRNIQFLLVMKIILVNAHKDPASNQLYLFKDKTCCGPVGILSTSTGTRVDYNDTITLNQNLLTNAFFMDSMTHFVRERIPERVAFTKGAGAFGYFEVTHDVTDICKAKFLSEIGKRTHVAVRFSLAMGDKGGADTTGDFRGFAIKFYSEEGNFDLVGLNTPTFSIKDPLYFVSLARATKRNPVTNFKDLNMFWDFFTSHPESLNTLLYLFSGPIIPDGYRHIPCFGIHTYQVVNKGGQIYFVRFHFAPDQGLKNLSLEEASKILTHDPDYAGRDLYNAIANGYYPSWTAYVQVLSIHDVRNATFDVNDITKYLPLDQYPARPIGRLVLNKNALNYFAEIEQLAFNPGNLVPGIQGAFDKVFQARQLAYRDAQYHRMGPNFHNIPVNCPLRSGSLTYIRDGYMQVNGNMLDGPNYYPNSFNGPVSYKEKNKVQLLEFHEDQPNNFDQARDFYLKRLSEHDRNILINNIVMFLNPTNKSLQDRAVELLALIQHDLSYKVRQGLKRKQN